MTLPVRRGRYGTREGDPFGRWGFDSLFDQMSRMLSNAFPDVARITVNSWAPPVDVQELDDVYVIEADLPGVLEEDVSVDLHGRELRISGEYGSADRQEGEQQPEGEQRMSGRRSGRFDYRVSLPGDVDPESCTANLDHGILRMRLPKAAASRGRRIPVQAGQPQQVEGGTGTPAG